MFRMRQRRCDARFVEQHVDEQLCREFIAGKMRLMTESSFSRPATLFCSARKSSAIPPVASLRRSVYLPNRFGSPSDAAAFTSFPLSAGRGTTLRFTTP